MSARLDSWALQVALLVSACALCSSCGPAVITGLVAGAGGGGGGSGGTAPPSTNNPPQTFVIASLPLGVPTRQTTITLNFLTDRPENTFQAQLDGGPWHSVTSPQVLMGLTEGTHTYRVRAVAPGGIVDPTPALAVWTIDLTPPLTTITDRPSEFSSSPDASVSFEANEMGCTFEGRLNGSTWFDTTSPFTVAGLADGLQVFEVRASDAAGNEEAMPVRVEWTVDRAAPEVSVVFPPPHALTDALTLTVRGNAIDAAGIAAVSVDGVAATTNDEYASWLAGLTLGLGVSSVQVAAEDLPGNSVAHPELAVVTRTGSLFEEPTAYAAFAPGQGAVLDRTAGLLLIVDLLTGEREVLSSAAVGSGPSLAGGLGLAVDAAAGRAVVTVPALGNALVSVDLATGARAIVSADGVGAGPTLAQPWGVALAGGAAYVGCTGTHKIVAVDLTTGARAVVSSASLGLGPVPVLPGALLHDGPNNRLLVVDYSGLTLLAVSLASGDRSLLSGTGTGAGPALGSPRGLAWGATPATVLVADQSPAALVSIGLASGNRTVLSSALVGGGIQILHPTAAGFDDTAARALLLDAGRDAVLAIDPASGLRTELSSTFLGEGDPFESPVGVALDDATIWVADASARAVIAVDRASGDRSARSTPSLGAGVPFGQLRDLVKDCIADKLLVVDSGLDALLTVDTASGARSVVSDSTVGSGPLLVTPVAVDLDCAAGLAYVVDSALAALIAIDLATGARTMVSSDTMGTGPTFAIPVDLALDLAAGRAFVLDLSQERIYTVDLATGNRAEFFGGVPQAVTLHAPRRLALDPDRARLVVVNGFSTELIAVDTTNGFRTIISSPTVGGGPLPRLLENLTLAGSDSVAILVDSSQSAVLAIDLETGERVIGSK